MSDRVEKACVNCHFLSTRPGANPEYRTVTEDERNDIRKKGTYDWIDKVNHVKCYHGVWTSLGSSVPEKKKMLVIRDRTDECFFFKHRSEMSLEAAEKLQKREEDRERFWERNKWVRRGALAAIVAVILNAIFRVISFFW